MDNESGSEAVRVAEEKIFEGVSTGAQNDLQRATEIARTMVTQFGMSENLGLVVINLSPGGVL